MYRVVKKYKSINRVDFVVQERYFFFLWIDMYVYYTLELAIRKIDSLKAVIPPDEVVWTEEKGKTNA